MVITLPSYAVGGHPFSVVVEKINHWHRIEYNGRSGTCIVMDGGAELTTDLMPYEVEKRIDDGLLIHNELNTRSDRNKLRELLRIEFLRHDRIEAPWHCVEDGCPYLGKPIPKDGCKCYHKLATEHHSAVKREIGL